MESIQDISEDIGQDISEDISDDVHDYTCDEIIETRPTAIELKEYFDSLSLQELYDELPLKNIYIDFNHFQSQIEQTEGETLLEKFCKLTIQKCKDRIKYISDKRDSLELCDADTDEINEILKIENEALDYFFNLFVKPVSTETEPL